MTLLLPRRAVISPAKAHALPWRLPAAVPLYAAATSSSMVSQISLPVVGYGIVTRHDGICGKEQPREAPSRRMFLCGIDLAGRFGFFSARAKIRSPKKLASFREMTSPRHLLFRDNNPPPIRF